MILPNYYPKTDTVGGHDDKLELIYKNSQTFFVLACDCDTISITSFHRWEQAFRIFSNIYLKERPDRASELIQYNHVIFTASNTFTWENVYQYDREFRIHLGSFPERSWDIILQQAWSMYLKDRYNSQFRANNGFHYQVKERNLPMFQQRLMYSRQGMQI